MQYGWTGKYLFYTLENDGFSVKWVTQHGHNNVLHLKTSSSFSYFKVSLADLHLIPQMQMQIELSISFPKLTMGLMWNSPSWVQTLSVSSPLWAVTPSPSNWVPAKTLGSEWPASESSSWQLVVKGFLKSLLCSSAVSSQVWPLPLVLL